MAVTSFAYLKAGDSLAQKKIDIDTDTIKCMLMASYTPGQSTHQYVSDVKAAGTEATGTGYTAGGVTLTGVTWAISGSSWQFKATIPAWDATGGSLAAAYAVFYDATPGTDATNPVLCYWNLNGGATVTASNATFTLTQNAAGIFTITI